MLPAAARRSTSVSRSWVAVAEIITSSWQLRATGSPPYVGGLGDPGRRLRIPQLRGSGHRNPPPTGPGAATCEQPASDVSEPFRRLGITARRTGATVTEQETCDEGYRTGRILS